MVTRSLYVPGVLVMRPFAGGATLDRSAGAGYICRESPLLPFCTALGKGASFGVVDKRLVRPHAAALGFKFPEELIDPVRFPLVHRAAVECPVVSVVSSSGWPQGFLQLSPTESIRGFEFLGMFDANAAEKAAERTSGYNFNLRRVSGGRLNTYVHEVRRAALERASDHEVLKLLPDDLWVDQVLQSASGGLFGADAANLAVLLARCVIKEHPGETLPGVPPSMSAPTTREGQLTTWERRLAQLTASQNPTLAAELRAALDEGRRELPVYGAVRELEIPALSLSVELPARVIQIVEAGLYEGFYPADRDERLEPWRAGCRISDVPASPWRRLAKWLGS